MADINVKVTFDKINVKEKIQEHKVKILMLKGEKGDTGNAVWGSITGDISTQTDLQNVLNGKASAESVATNTSDISSLQSDVSTNTSDISSLQSSVATNTSDISRLQSSVATSTGKFDYNTSYFSTVNFNDYIKYGKVVICEFSGLISNNIPNNTEIFTLPFRPNIRGEITLYLGGQYDYQNTIWAYTTTDQSYLKIGNGAKAASGKWLHAYFVYICY